LKTNCRRKLSVVTEGCFKLLNEGLLRISIRRICKLSVERDISQVNYKHINIQAVCQTLEIWKFGKLDKNQTNNWITTRRIENYKKITIFFELFKYRSYSNTVKRISNIVKTKFRITTNFVHALLRPTTRLGDIVMQFLHLKIILDQFEVKTTIYFNNNSNLFFN